MNREERKMLTTLTALAQLKAERSLAALARAEKRCQEVRARLAEREGAVRAALGAARTPRDGLVAVRFATLAGQQRAALLTELAQAEAARAKAFADARTEEGRRQALAHLSDQAS